MTIRLRCAECQRKLKVPDEALGKTVQCPVCGARFLGHLEGSPPLPLVPQEPVLEEMAPVPPRMEPPHALSHFPSLELEEPAAIEADAVAPIVLDEETILEVTESADEMDEVVEEEPEVVEDEEPATNGKQELKKKKKRGWFWS